MAKDLDTPEMDMGAMVTASKSGQEVGKERWRDYGSSRKEQRQS